MRRTLAGRRSRITLFSVLLPVALMLGKALVDIFIDDETQWFRQIFDLLGTPLFALLIAVIVGMFTLGRGAGMARDESPSAWSRVCPRSPASS